jgi:YbbR domain-containing protein
MNKWFENNMVLRLVALLLGILIWLGVGDHSFSSLLKSDQDQMTIHDVYLEQRYDQQTQKLLHLSQDKVDLTIIGKKETLQRLSPSYHAYIDLHNLPAGKYQSVAVKVQGLPQNVQYQVNPKRVWVMMDRQVSKTLAVRIQYGGKYKEQLAFVSPEISTKTVTVSGPESLVRQVRSVEARITMNEWVSPNEQEVTLQPMGKKGVIKGVQLSTTTMTFRIPAGWVEKELPLHPIVQQPPPSGITVKQMEPTPKTIRFFGRVEALDVLNEVRIPVDLSKINGDQQLETDLQLPSDVTYFPQQKVKIMIKTEKQTPASS